MAALSCQAATPEVDGAGGAADAEPTERSAAAPVSREVQGGGGGARLAPPGDPAAAESRPAPAPRFHGEVLALSAETREHMKGGSWRPGCPVALDDLVLLTVKHWNMDGEVAEGEMVVAADVAAEVLAVFESLFEIRFPIERMRRIAHYDGDDDASMADNNSSGFNCRRVAGTTRWSEHSFGTAIDINPLQNPFVAGDDVKPAAGAAYLARDDVRPGMFVPGPAVGAFEEIGWGWGGDWRSLKDYQHFSRSGR